MRSLRAAISRVHYPIHSLGPGSRLGIWFQGCSIRCKGCISTDTWDEAVADIEIKDLIDRIRPWLIACEGITISGGEPFNQPEGLIGLVKAIKKIRNIDILVYSGHPFERIASVLEDMEGLVDVVISDPFLVSEKQTLALRGSDNQRMTLLTPLGQERFGGTDRLRNTEDDRLDLMMDENGSAWMAGIPKRGDLTRLKDLLNAEGHTCHTTEAPAHATEHST